ncbi:MAG: sugar phosphate isomerase/epimerase [Candidatus Omnitrophica bacterium]|nr:sugar phosphate isomerase/epimerase [Candidatus Omnitrophota bacterium]
MFALSLSWNVNKFRSAKKQIDEIVKVGFKELELNFSLTEKRIRQIDRLRKEGMIRILSCHNFCPIPNCLSTKKALPDYYSISSLNEKKRRLALKYTKKSIETASQLKARALILHSGRVDMQDKSKQLMQLFAAGKGNSSAFKSIKNRMRILREKRKKPHLEKALTSIGELSNYAKKLNVKLGLENRIYYSEIPQLDEFDILLQNTNAFFWFDTGHARIMQKLWGIREKEYLKRYSSKFIGVHLHDVIGMQDHLAPGVGELNFKSLAPYIKRNTIKVIEAHAAASKEELGQSINFLNKIFS